MYNWSVDTNALKKDSEQYLIWELEQLINFGLGREKLDKKKLKKYFDKLDIDKEKRKYLEFLLS